MNAHEEGFLRFVRRERRQRVAHLLTKKNLARSLPHFMWLDERYMTPITHGDHNVETILHRLRKLSPSQEGYVISELLELDGQTLPLQTALEGIVGSQMGSVISVDPGRVAYYEGETPHTHGILHRPD